MAEPRYGRGKYQAHPAYIKYMGEIVRHKSYAGMPNAVSPDGRINWQVSSGKSTSFYKYYLERFDWWVAKANSLNVRGKGNSDDRFSITARLIHPTGYRPCRLCGELRNVGYFYLNNSFASLLNKKTETTNFSKRMTVTEALDELKKLNRQDVIDTTFPKIFPERAKYFSEGITSKSFEESNYLRSGYLSPGYMCNPPDRLDGFHDYCIFCREDKDPGRSRENLRSYMHDRRVFELWSEGDWLLADALYNSAGPGVCYICGKKLAKVSPDHIGPLSCGFKQLPLFLPTCTSCNSSKNRRLFLADVKHLIQYEEKTGESVASWQVKPLWDHYKNLVKSDRDAKELSDYMRAIQDYYLRTLFALFKAGYSEYLVTLLHPEYALFDIQFKNLDRGKLTFDEYVKTPVATKLRNSLSNRSIRIAFEELQLYQVKPLADRKIRKVYMDGHTHLMDEIVKEAKKVRPDATSRAWDRAMKADLTKDAREIEIASLRAKPIQAKKYASLDKLFKKAFTTLSASTAIPLGEHVEKETQAY